MNAKVNQLFLSLLQLLLQEFLDIVKVLFLDTVKVLERHDIFSLQLKTWRKVHMHYTYRDKPVGVDSVNQSG